MSSVNSIGDEDITEDLLIALFAVAGWNLENAAAAVKNIRAQQANGVAALKGLSEDEIAKTISRSGFNRGAKVLQIMTERVFAVMSFLNQDNMSKLNLAIEMRDADQIAHLLKSVKGIGPKVVSNFKVLRNIGG